MIGLIIALVLSIGLNIFFFVEWTCSDTALDVLYAYMESRNIVPTPRELNEVVDTYFENDKR